MDGSKMEHPIPEAVPESTQEIDYSSSKYRKVILDGQEDDSDSNQKSSVKEDAIRTALTFKRKSTETQDKRDGDISQNLRVKKDITCDDQIKRICSGYNAGLHFKEGVSFNKEKWKDSNLREIQIKNDGKATFPWTAPDGEKYFVKEFDRRDKTRAKIDPNEILIPLRCPEDGIVKLHGLKCDGDKLWILMEHAGQQLRKALGDDKFKERLLKNILDFILQLMQIFKILEAENILHRDVKPENICVSLKGDKFKFTLVDFGSAQRNLDKTESPAHTKEYLPPILVGLLEKMKEKISSDAFFKEKCDVWAAALIVLEIILGRHPYPFVAWYLKYCLDEETLNQARKYAFCWIAELKDVFFESILSQHQIQEPIKEILRNTLVIHRENSWTAKDVCNHLESMKEQNAAASDTGKDPHDQPQNKRRKLQADAKTAKTPNKAEGFSHESQQLVDMKPNPMAVGLNQQMSNKSLSTKPAPTVISSTVLKKTTNVQPFDEETKNVEQVEIAAPSATADVSSINQSQPFEVSPDEENIVQSANEETRLPNSDLVEQGDSILNCQPESTLGRCQDEVTNVQHLNNTTVVNVPWIPNFDLIEQGDSVLNCQPESSLWSYQDQATNFQLVNETTIFGVPEIPNFDLITPNDINSFEFIVL